MNAAQIQAKAMSVRALVDAAQGGDLTGLTGAVYCAVQHSHGIPFAAGLWARIVGATNAGHSTPGRGKGGGSQRTPKIKVRFYEFEAQARAGKGKPMGPGEVDVTFAMLEKTVPPATDVVSPEGGEPADDRALTRGRGLGAARPADDEGEEEDDDDDCESLPPLEEDVDEIDDDVAPPTASKTPSKTKAKAAAREAAGKTDERALIAELKGLGFNAGSIDGLISKVGYATVKEWQALRGLGEAQAKELAADAGLNPAQRGLLMAHMKSMAAPSSILNDLHESADEDEDDEDNEDAEGRTPAPAKGGNPTPTPKAGGRPLVTALVGKVPPALREEVLGEALELVYEALNGRLPTAAQRKRVELSLEASLRAIGATVTSVTPASPRSVESVMEAVLALTMGYSPGQKAAGRGGARGAMPVDDEEDDEAAAGWIQGSGKQDLAMQQALNALAGDRKAQAAVKAMVAMEDAEVLQALSAAGADRNLAALAYKADAELKPPAGARHTLAMGELMHGVGAVREKVADVLARRVLRPLLPVGSDELALAGKLARGRLDHLDWEKAFGSGAAKSSMGSLGGARAAPRSGATADILLVFVRAMSVLAAGYGAAHPFDTTVVQTVVELQTVILKAVQRGVEVKTATDAVLDPFLWAMARRWDAVARRAGMRPVMAEVRAELAHNEKDLSEVPATVKAPAVEGGAEAAKLKKENAALREKVAGLEKKAAGEWVGKREKWESANPGKCFFWTEHQKCTQGKHCRNASQPGHVQ